MVRLKRQVGSVKVHLLAGVLLAASAGSAAALDIGDWNVAPYETTLWDGIQLKLRATAYGSAYTAEQPGAAGLAGSGVTGAAVGAATIERDYDSGLVLALKSSFQLYRDDLSVDNYGGDFVEKVYASVQTGLGRIELGNADGAAFVLSETGPVVESDISIDNTNASFFRDPSTGTAFINVFALNSATEASLNYAKISYYTPRLFGVQLGASFTPSEGKDVVPFLDGGPDLPDRQKNIWEGAISYSDYVGPVSVGFSGGIALAHDDRKTPGHAGLTDWSLGTRFEYSLSDDVKLALGGAYRRSNAYAFDIGSVFASGETVSSHASATISTGSWIFGAELGEGAADGRLGSPDLSVHGASATVGYVLNSNMQLDAGWEHFTYKRDTGVFYNGLPKVTMDAVFLHLQFQI
jgi:hypothetical protein